ncbi:MAG: PG0541 family transporter-associated protein [Spirochaetota bacterium]
MQRLEIIANRSVEEDLFDQLKRRGLSPFYTKLPEVQGVGDSGPRQGDHVWPEENFLMIIYCEQSVANQLRDLVGELKRLFPDEGITMFSVQAQRLD